MSSLGNLRAGFDRATREYRSLAAIVAGLAIVQAAVGALSAFVPLTLIARGEPAWAVGLAASAYGGGFLMGALRAPHAIRAIGHIRSFSAVAAFATVVALGLFAFPGIASWAILEGAFGFCVASLLTTGESWVAELAPRERRGALLAYYLVVSKVGQIAGPVALAALAPGDASGFMAIAALFATSLIPVSATRRAQPAPLSAEPFGVGELWSVAPGAVIAAFIAGAVNGSVLQLYAVFAREVSVFGAMGAAAAFNGALALGSGIAQWPAGWLSDRTDRRKVIVGLAAFGGVISLALGLGANMLTWSAILFLAALWGAASMSFYGVAVAHAADRAAPGRTTGVIAGILVVWALGALIGPFVAGAAMTSSFGARALFLYAAAGLSLLAAAMVVRRVRAAAPAPHEKSPFAIAPATSTAAAAIDPRRDEMSEQPDLFSETRDQSP